VTRTLAIFVFAGCSTGTGTDVRPPSSVAPYQLGEFEARAAALLFVGSAVDGDIASLRAMADSELDVSATELAHINESATVRLTHAAEGWAAHIDAHCWTYSLTLTPRDRSFHILAVSASQRCSDPDEPPHPVHLPPGTLEKIRSVGSLLITPDEETIATLPPGTKERYIGSWKLCIDTAGTVTLMKRQRSTGLPAYDATIEREIARWRFHPWLVQDKPTPACASPTFVYARQ